MNILNGMGVNKLSGIFLILEVNFRTETKKILL